MTTLNLIFAISTAAYKGMLHSHSTFMILYVIHHIVKVILLLSNQHVTLEKYRKATKIPLEMIVPTIALGCGVALYLTGPYGINNLWFNVTLIGTVVGIGLGIAAFRKNEKISAVISALIFIYLIGVGYTKSVTLSKNAPNQTIINMTPEQNTQGQEIGKALYVSKCQLCHGPNGDLMLAGAKNLQISVIPDKEIKNQIVNGKGAMPAFASQIKSDEELKALITYVKGLRK